MAGFNFNMGNMNISNLMGNIDFNSMVPDIGTIKSKLPEGIRNFIPDVDIKSKVDINGKMKEIMDGAMGDSNSEINEAMNEAMNDFNPDNMINESFGGMNLDEYGLGTNDLMSQLPSGITIG